MTTGRPRAVFTPPPSSLVQSTNAVRSRLAHGRIRACLLMYHDRIESWEDV